MSTNVLISCLEVSADHIAAFLIRYLNSHYPGKFHFLCIAGEEVRRIKAKNVEIINDLVTLSNIGVFGNVRNFFIYLRFLKWFKRYLLTRQAKKQAIDVFLAVDGQGVNIPLGKIAKKNNLKTIYFFPPPVFTFGRGVLRKMKCFDLIFCPFEKDYFVYREKKFPAHYIGHPYHYIFKNELFSAPRKGSSLANWFNNAKKTISIFPGSRLLEIKKHTPIFLKAAKLIMKSHSEVEFIISLAHEEFRPYITQQLKALDLKIPIFHAYSDHIIKKSFFIFATSGTTTLKASFMGTPHVIAYQLDPISYWIYQWLIRFKLMIYTPYIGTINVYEEKLVTEELMNEDFNEKKLAAIASNYLKNPNFHAARKKELLQIAKKFNIANPFQEMTEIILKSLK